MTIQCPRCQAASPDGNRFCGACGFGLQPEAATVREYVDGAMRQQVEAAVAARFKDQKLLEVETAQAIAARLTDWAKLFGFFVGVPAALVLLVLAILGIKTYSDFTSQVQRAQAEVTKKLETAGSSAEKLKGDSEKLALEYDKLSARLRDTTAIAAQLDSLTRRVDQIGEKVGISPTSNVSASQKAQIQAAFTGYQQYLGELGYGQTKERVELDVRGDLLQKQGAVAYYEPDKRRMVIDSKYVTEPIVLYREYMHHVLMGGRKLGNSPEHYALESGIAWYLPCSFVGRAETPAVSAWKLTNQRRFSEIRPGHESALVDGTEIWGAAFWEIRQILGQRAADKLILDAWFRLRPAVPPRELAATFAKLLSQDGTHAAAIREIFSRRGVAV
ncbi:zinc ribbon domain-containing protein [Ramlibacter sp. USB13]|uniref:Zinc ribbon domain-containing protein n=1 Tax=Ramlibacter cellulosilyticus TaxID=2764187 RepID=A0A923MS96_9BURK|nr:zinc ribbon domain-containing protein [Ramlibacter cellulosilyticus]MBC5784041.1 zinc ribbon domain-containing protein [Ramlibacter cellulosilyticus]